MSDCDIDCKDNSRLSNKILQFSSNYFEKRFVLTVLYQFLLFEAVTSEFPNERTTL